MYNFKGFNNITERFQNETVKLGLEAGCKNVHQSDVQILPSHSEKLMNEELIQLNEERPKEDNENDNEEKE
jgi:hypothetical protein